MTGAPIPDPNPCHYDQDCAAEGNLTVAWPGGTAVPYCYAHAKELLAEQQALSDRIQDGFDGCIRTKGVKSRTQLAQEPVFRTAPPAAAPNLPPTPAPPKPPLPATCHGGYCEGTITTEILWPGHELALPYCAVHTAQMQPVAVAYSALIRRVQAGIARVAASRAARAAEAD